LEANVRNAARIKLGYYPLPPEEGKHLRKLLDFSTGTASVVDPCAGTGAALHQLTDGARVEKHGVELDANRAAAATATGIRTIHGDLFNAIGKVETFSFLYLNPPYDAEIGSMDNKRMEFLFLEHTHRWLVEGGVLLMVVPQARLDSSIPLLSENFANLQVFRLTDPESERFDQVALLGVRKRMRGQDYSQNRAALHEMVWRRDMPTLQGNETPYRVPASASTPLVYRGLPLDQIEDLIGKSSAWKQVEALLLPKEEMAGGRPITPLHAGHVGLLCTAGLLNGVFGQGDERHIARWRSLKSVTVFEVEGKGYAEVHKREQFTNELVLVYEDGRTLVLRDKKKEDEDAERTLAAGAA
jgi:16S rRNA G966 N2-methylase RsmD